MASSSPKAALFWPLLAAVVAIDHTTKLLAVAHLSPQHVPHDVVGDTVRLTLAYNRGASFGIEVGEYSRVLFIVLAAAALAILGRLYQTTTPGETRRIAALGLICGGAIGNLIDRVRSSLGVIDFIDLGVGDVRWYTFNVADVAITGGAALLAVVLWRQDAPQPALSEAGPGGPPHAR
jgi:signal peptidase II